MSNIHKIDVAGQSVGRIAGKIAHLLQGKDKVDYAPNKDIGDPVEVSNVDQVKFTGKKFDQKTYFSHSGYLGHEKNTPLSKIFKRDPGEVLRRAVWNMLPKNRLRKERMKKLIIKND